VEEEREIEEKHCSWLNLEMEEREIRESD